jgi:hypothetical protein
MKLFALCSLLFPRKEQKNIRGYVAEKVNGGSCFILTIVITFLL